MNRFASISFLIVALVVPTAIAQPQVPDAIKVPDGHKPVATLEAIGVQIYKAVKGKSGELEWEFELPLADLANTNGDKVGIHYHGPAWEAADGSNVFKPKDKLPSSAKAKKATDLPWLLVPVTSNDAKGGTFSKVVYIQRISTSGGMPPAEVPKRMGSRIAVPYTATYVFWSKAE
jgi:hypothetical protein